MTHAAKTPDTSRFGTWDPEHSDRHTAGTRLRSRQHPVRCEFGQLAIIGNNEQLIAPQLAPKRPVGDGTALVKPRHTSHWMISLLYSPLFIALIGLHPPATISTSNPTSISSTMPSSKPAGWPGALPLEVDGYPLAPPELELEQVHIDVRHGQHFS